MGCVAIFTPVQMGRSLELSGMRVLVTIRALSKLQFVDRRAACRDMAFRTFDLHMFS
jgi:hypothetical protein